MPNSAGDHPLNADQMNEIGSVVIKLHYERVLRSIGTKTVIRVGKVPPIEGMEWVGVETPSPEGAYFFGLHKPIWDSLHNSTPHPGDEDKLRDIGNNTPEGMSVLSDGTLMSKGEYLKEIK